MQLSNTSIQNEFAGIEMWSNNTLTQENKNKLHCEKNRTHNIGFLSQ